MVFRIFLFYKSKYKDGFYTNCAASVAFVFIVVIGSDLYNFKVTAYYGRAKHAEHSDVTQVIFYAFKGSDFSKSLILKPPSTEVLKNFNPHFLLWLFQRTVHG